MGKEISGKITHYLHQDESGDAGFHFVRLQIAEDRNVIAALQDNRYRPFVEGQIITGLETETTVMNNQFNIRVQGDPNTKPILTLSDVQEIGPEPETLFDQLIGQPLMSLAIRVFGAPELPPDVLVLEQQAKAAFQDGLEAKKPQKSPDTLAYEARMGEWDQLNQAVGGDLFDNPHKLAAMRKIDHSELGRQVAAGEVPWSTFQERVVAAVEAIDYSAPPPRAQIDTAALMKAFKAHGLGIEDMAAIFKARRTGEGDFFDENLEFKAEAFDAWAVARKNAAVAPALPASDAALE